jgi:hypothetical protein
MKRLIAILLCGTVGLLSAAETGFPVTYEGGSISSVKAGVGMKLFIDPAQIRISKDKEDIATIPAAAVIEISYGQDVHRRVGAAIGLAFVSFGIGGLMALTKSKKHFHWPHMGRRWQEGWHGVPGRQERISRCFGWP